MGLLGTKLRTVEGNRLGYWCPGCDEMHVVQLGSVGWTWDGNIESPTFSPSILVRSGHYLGEKNCWCKYNEEHPEKTAFSCSVCHSFIIAGQIQFLGACTHSLAGKTVSLPIIDDSNI